MRRGMHLLRRLIELIGTLLILFVDAVRFLLPRLRPRPALAAENLFLGKQLVRYQERGTKPRRAPDATRIAMTWLAGWSDWRQALAVVQPATLTRSPGSPCCAGDGHLNLDDHRSRRPCKRSCVVWSGRSRHGARSASPTSSSSLACGFHRARCGNTRRGVHTAVSINTPVSALADLCPQPCADDCRV